MKIKITIENEFASVEQVIKNLANGELKSWELLEILINYREKRAEAIFEIGAE